MNHHLKDFIMVKIILWLIGGIVAFNLLFFAGAFLFALEFVKLVLAQP